MQKQQQDGILIQEQNPGEENPLFRIIVPTHPNAHEQKQDTTHPTRPQTKHSVTTTQQDNNSSR
jgi:hypothetical protein